MREVKSSLVLGLSTFAMPSGSFGSFTANDKARREKTISLTKEGMGFSTRTRRGCH